MQHHNAMAALAISACLSAMAAGAFAQSSTNSAGASAAAEARGGATASAPAGGASAWPADLPATPATTGLEPPKAVHDLGDPRYTPPEAPAWAVVIVPEWVRPYVGRNGLPPAWCDRKGPLATSVKGVDRYQANHFITYRPETAKYLYAEYTPLTLDYRKGMLPTYEKVVAEYTAGLKTDTEKAVALLTKAMTKVSKHPTMPPSGGPVRADRALEDEPLLQSGLAWCNEQARIYVRLCQVAGIPARIIHLFYSDGRTGHTIAEFHADGRWSMADASWFCVFPGPDGKLLSAAQCHDGAEGQKHCGAAYYKRFQVIAQMSDAELGSNDPDAKRKDLAAKTAEELAAKMGFFAVMNNPLPK